MGKTSYKCGKLNHLSSEYLNTKKLCYNCKELTDRNESYNCPNKTVRMSNNANRKKYRNFKILRGGRGRTQESSGQRRGGHKGSKLFRRVKVMDSNHGEKYVFIAEGDTEAYIDENDEVTEANLVEGNKHLNNKNFIVDTGASEHMVNGEKYLSNIVDMKNDYKIKSANKNSSADLKIEKTGELVAKGVGGNIIELKNVLYSKNLSKNLLSVRKLINKGVTATFSDKDIKLLDEKNNKVLKTGNYDGKFWWLNFELVNDISTHKNAFGHYNNKSNSSRNEPNSSNSIDHEYCKLNLEGSNQREHNYARQSYVDAMLKENEINNTVEIEEISADNLITQDNIKEQSASQKYLDTASEMNISDLEELNKVNLESLKGDIGLLWLIIG